MHFLSLTLFLSLLSFSSLPADEPKSTITFTSPLDYQVFQRSSKTQGAIIVAGKAERGAALEVRIGEKDWQSLTIDLKSHRFDGKLDVPAGGWYSLEYRLLVDGKPIETGSVAHVGVGEVFIVAGQSNSCNYGSEKQKPTSGNVAAFEGTRWQLAEDPQPGGGGKGGSFIPAFADLLVAKYDIPVGVVCCGIGSTSVRQWLPKGSIFPNRPTTTSFVKSAGDGKWEATGEPFEKLAKRLEKFGPNGVRAVLWHQGESDAGQARGGAPAEYQITGKQYAEYMHQVIAESRKRADWKVPWLVAQATYHSESDPADEEFRAAQKSLWDDGAALQGPDTDTLRKPLRAGVHFNAEGLKAHGKLWAEKVMALIDR